MNISQFDPSDTQATYDTVAERYAQEIATELDNKPFDREFLDKFAAAVAGEGKVADLGCGPGHVGAYLAERGVEVVGLDLSPRMVEIAQARYPNVEFVFGDMLALPFANNSLAGVIAFYSIIHFDDRQLARAFAEMHRVLARESLLALAFHIGDEVVHREQWWDMPVVLDARFLPTELVTGLLADAGLEVIWVEERDPYALDVEYQSRRAYLVARPLVPLPGGRPPLPPLGLGYPRTELRRELAHSVMRGDKTATAGLAQYHAPHTHVPLPEAGDRWALLDYQDEPIAVVETTAVEVVPAGQVALQFAIDEGEGFESVADWRAAHERFWSDQQITDDTPIVCERFRVVERLD